MPLDLPQRLGTELVRRLKALWPAPPPHRVRRRRTPRHTAARPSTLRRPWRQRCLTWGVGLGLLVGLVWSAPSLWRLHRLPRVPPGPQTRSDHAAVALPGTEEPVAQLTLEPRLPTQSQTSAERASVRDATPVGIIPGVPLQRSQAAVAQSTTHHKFHTAAQPRAAHAERPWHGRRRHTTLLPATPRHPIHASADAGTATRPRQVQRARVFGAHRPGEWLVALPAPQPPWQWVASDPAPEVERPWNRRIVNETTSE
jgi:hypothetical protein